MENIIQQIGGQFSVNVIKYLAFAGMPFLIFYRFFSGKFATSKIQQRTAAKADFLREVKYSLLSSLVFSVIACVLVFTPISEYTLIYRSIDSYPFWWIPLSLGLSLIIHDTYFYWMHRLLHHPTIYKKVHLLHHKSINPSPWAAYSFHFFESLTEGGILLVLAFVLPLHPLTGILFIISAFIINVYGHLGYEIMPRFLRHTFIFEIINTSVHHNLHHSRFKGNYGLYFRVWDRLCKTEYPDYVKEYDRVQSRRLGEKDPQQVTENQEVLRA